MTEPSIITIGNFDGVHLGHRAILNAARQQAQASHARVLAITFDPMPIAVLRPGEGPPHLGTIDQRIAALKASGADDVIVLTPTKELLSQDAKTFIAGLIQEQRAVGFVEGEDFRFGAKRSGDMAMLTEMGSEQGFSVRALPRIEVPLSDQSVAPISSSLVRWLVGRGRVEDAAVCMGRHYELAGSIVRGDQRGRGIGVPTANLNPDAYRGLIVPMDGVYAGSVTLDDGPVAHPAAISVGLKPTFGAEQLTVEAHLIGYQTPHPDALYGRYATIRFARWVRDQYPFPGVDALVQQLQRDIALCSCVLNEPLQAYD